MSSARREKSLNHVPRSLEFVREAWWDRTSSQKSAHRSTVVSYAHISPCRKTKMGKKMGKTTANLPLFQYVSIFITSSSLFAVGTGHGFFSVPGTVSFTGSVVGPISGCPDSNDAWATYQAIQATSCISRSVLAHHWMATS